MKKKRNKEKLFHENAVDFGVFLIRNCKKDNKCIKVYWT